MHLYSAMQQHKGSKSGTDRHVYMTDKLLGGPIGLPYRSICTVFDFILSVNLFLDTSTGCCRTTAVQHAGTSSCFTKRSWVIEDLDFRKLPMRSM
jgi:hypothetical protein